MPDIIHEFSVKAPQQAVFEMFATPAGLDKWWTKTSSGEPKLGGTYRLFFGAGYDWKAKVTECAPGLSFELQMTDAHEDWMGSKVGCKLSKEGQAGTRVLFSHKAWPEANEHWRTSNFCWAMYLRILRRSLEYGDAVPYEKRLDVSGLCSGRLLKAGTLSPRASASLRCLSSSLRATGHRPWAASSRAMLCDN